MVALGILDMSIFLKKIYPFKSHSKISQEDYEINNIFCPVCGEKSNISPFTANMRESGFCSNCGSWNRQRLLAILLIKDIQKRFNLRIESLSSKNIPDNIRIFNAEWFGAIHKTLKHISGYSWSKYSGSKYRSGEIVEGVTHQDLQETSFQDNQFDIVLTSDVLEHIPEPYLAHKEIYRILKPGGVHIFTVPSIMKQPVDVQHAIKKNNEIVHLTEPKWHGKKIESNLVYTVFGLEMISHLWNIGFNVKFYEVNYEEMGVIGPRSFGFLATKDHYPLKNYVPVGLRNLKPKYFNKIDCKTEHCQNKNLNGTLLFVDYTVPMYDKFAGSRTNFMYLKLFSKNGMTVKFIPADFKQKEPYTSELNELGIETLDGKKFSENWNDWLRDNGNIINYVFFNKPEPTIKFINAVKNLTKAAIIYQCHDLHYLRLRRKAEIEKNDKVQYEADRFEKQENYIFSCSDVILTYSAIEKLLIKEKYPHKKIFTVPLFFYEKMISKKKQFQTNP